MKFRISDNVIYIGCTQEQIAWGNNDNPNNILIIGKIYKISEVEIHSQHTKISLEGVVGKFNSVCFDSI